MLRGFSRAHEHRAVCAQMETLVVEREIDALIIAGDVFDSQNPAGEAQQLFYDTLVRLSRARPRMTIVILAGNHDAAGRLEAPRPLLEAFNIRVVGNVRRQDGRIEASRHLVPLYDAQGELAAHVMAVSYPSAACLPPMGRQGEGGGSPIVAGVRALYAELRERLAPAIGDLPLVVTGHLHVAGGIESEGAERRILIGGQHAVPHDVFPGDAAYVALGHLHRAQTVGRSSVRYAGSIIPLSATEQAYAHGVTLVHLGEGQTQITHLPLDRPVPFLRLPERGELRLADVGDHLNALGLSTDLPRQQHPFLQIRLTREGLTSGFREALDVLAESYPVRLVETRVAPLPETGHRALRDPLRRLVEVDPEEMFRRAFEHTFGAPPEAAHLEVFHQVRAES